MSLPKEINVTEQMVDISALTSKQNNYYHQLADELAEKYGELGRGRQIFTLSGPPGSGKSVVSAILNHIYSTEATFTFINVGSDAFHFPNAVLAERKLLDAKGRHDTYDTDQIFSKLLAFEAGEKVAFPYYSREDHNPIPDSLVVETKDILLLLEGQWLLSDLPDWSKVRKLSSYNLYVAGPLAEMRDNVIRRHIAGGRTTDDAMSFYKTNDLINTEDVQKDRNNADKKIKFYKNI